MGAGSSKVVVEVVVDRPFYYAGDTVTGSVVVHVPQALDVKSITLKVLAGSCSWSASRASTCTCTDLASTTLYRPS